MTRIAGTCTLKEEHGLPARVFALCDIGRSQFVPVSQPGHQQIAGVESMHEGRELMIRLQALPGTLRRLAVGLYLLPGTGDLARQDYRLRLAMDERHLLVVPRTRLDDAGGQKFVILGLAQLRPGGWEFGALQSPRLFPDKMTLSQTYPVSAWWLKHR